MGSDKNLLQKATQAVQSAAKMAGSDVSKLEWKKKAGGGISTYEGGLYCGPGWGFTIQDVQSGKIAELPPAIDAIDDACKHHDQCYDEHGYLTQECNVVLARNLAKVVKNPQATQQQRLDARIMAAIFWIEAHTIDVPVKKYRELRTKIEAAQKTLKSFGRQVVPCIAQAVRQTMEQPLYPEKKLASKLLSEVIKKYVVKPTANSLLRPDSVKGAANLIKAAGKSIKPLARQVSPDLAKVIGRATNNGTVNAVGKALRAFANKPAVVGGIAGGIASPIVEFAARAIQGKPLFSKPALFKYGSSAVKGIISGAIAGAIVGSVVPGPGTAVGLLAGLCIGVATSFVVDVAAKPVEDALMRQMRIQDD